MSLLESSNTNDWAKANVALDEIEKYQYSLAKDLIPSEIKINAELFFNEFNIFERLTPFYLILGFILIVLVFTNIFNPNIKIEKVKKITLYLLVIGFILHTLGLALRWYISGHAPWSNGYESMIYIAWAITLSGIFFSKQSHLALGNNVNTKWNYTFCSTFKLDGATNYNFSTSFKIILANYSRKCNYC